MIATVAPTAIPAMAPFDRPLEELPALAVDVAEVSGESLVVDGVSEGTSVVTEVLLVALVKCVEVEETALVELCAGLSLPTDGGPLVFPFSAWAACLIFRAVSPFNPGILKRSE